MPLPVQVKPFVFTQAFPSVAWSVLTVKAFPLPVVLKMMSGLISVCFLAILVGCSGSFLGKGVHNSANVYKKILQMLQTILNKTRSYVTKRVYPKLQVSLSLEMCQEFKGFPAP